MKRLAKFIGLNNKKKLILAKTLIITIFIFISLRILPYRIFLKAYKVLNKSIHSYASLEESIWAINVISQNFKVLSTCFVRVLVLKLLIKQIEINIGVKRDGGGSFQAHAWATIGNEMIFGIIPDVVEDKFKVLTNKQI